ncbi:MAG TPA: site-2 protease family protein [Gemmataceae bacterium]|jgi:Zn-dependent protease|nr:site-2 protease family protein [Gemmataceae bacterium]
MRDPMSWSIPLFRAFGIQVKLHILYIVITLSMLIRVYTQTGSKGHLAEFALIWVLMLFVVVLLHEFGHCFAARRVDGEAEEILMWPLGGLAYCAVPHTPRANFITTAGGPFVNVLICLACTAALASAGYLPPLNIFESRQLYHPELHNWQTGEDAKPFSDSPYFITDDGRRVASMNYVEEPDGKFIVPDPAKPGGLVHARRVGDVYPLWVLWTARLFWVSWMLFLFNLIPAFPLDGGRFLQEILWARSDDYRSATQIACWCGIVTSVVFMVLAIGFNESLYFGLGLFMLVASFLQLRTLEVEESGQFGYDFSKGYGGFGPDEDAPAPKPKRVGPIKRWMQARRSRKLKEEVEQRAADEARLDELLDKIGRLGKESLTAEERRFMDRVSARYRNRP